MKRNGKVCFTAFSVWTICPLHQGVVLSQLLYMYQKGDDIVKITVRLKEGTIKRNLQEIKYMILFDRIKLSSICRSQRTVNKSLYIMAFRASSDRSDCKEYMETLRILANDILLCLDDSLKKSLNNLLQNYLEYNKFTGDKTFEHYKETILQQMQIYK